MDANYTIDEILGAKEYNLSNLELDTEMEVVLVFDEVSYFPVFIKTKPAV